MKASVKRIMKTIDEFKCNFVFMLRIKRPTFTLNFYENLLVWIIVHRALSHHRMNFFLFGAIHLRYIDIACLTFYIFIGACRCRRCSLFSIRIPWFFRLTRQWYTCNYQRCIFRYQTRIFTIFYKTM